MSASGSSITGSLINTDQEDGKIIDNWRIPAVSERGAKLRAQGNSKVKGRSGTNVTEVERVGDGDLPGQAVYRVRVESAR